ncbi:MAG TPA: thioesterase family protein [Acidobacteriota bacterium]|nr:thioesterase family protein [Acidobacteriota bacterium]
MDRVSEFITRRKVEFADVDQAGIVHFSRFFIFMETAEHEFLRSLGTSVHSEWDDQKIGWPRLKAFCEYVAPAKFEDQLQIRVTILRKGKKSMTYGFEFTRNKDVVARGEMTSACCVLNSDGGMKAIEIPDWIANQIQEKSEMKNQK